VHVRWSIIVIAAAALALPAAAAGQARIVGGNEAEGATFQSRWSSIAAVLSTGSGGSALCGGVVIDRRTVLTAAHCTLDQASHPIAPSRMEVVVGRRVATSSDGDRVPVESITRHPGYSRATMRNDIAVMRLERDPDVAPGAIQLTSLVDESWWGAGAGMPIGSTNVGPWIAGWGATNAAGTTFPSALQEAMVTVAADSACGAPWAPGHGSSFDPGTMICAGLPSATGHGGIDSCHGDSGGPLIVGNGSGEWRLVGITSWGRDCGGRYYGVYTRVGRFTAWIEPLRYVPSTAPLTPSSNAAATPTAPVVPTPAATTQPTGVVSAGGLVAPDARPAPSPIGPALVAPALPAPAPTRSTSMPTRLRVWSTRVGLRVTWRRSRGDANPIRYRVLLRTRRGWRVRAITRRTRIDIPRRWLSSPRTFVRIQAFDRRGARSRTSRIVVLRRP
jgi:secreted trypsin-like serine protease